MSMHFFELPLPAVTGEGAALRADGFIDKAVQAFVSAGEATVEGSMDGETYTDIGGGAVTADAWLSIPWVVKWIRVNVATELGAGDKFIMGGRTP